MGINCNVSRAIIFDPKHLGGMSLRHLHTLQGILRMQYFMGQIANNDGIGKLIQLEVGNFEPFLFLLHSVYGKYTLTSTWVHKIWSFLELFQGTTTLTKSLLPSPQQQNNQS
jgi:hypothetical protein